MILDHFYGRAHPLREESAAKLKHGPHAKAFATPYREPLKMSVRQSSPSAQAQRNSCAAAVILAVWVFVIAVLPAAAGDLAATADESAISRTDNDFYAASLARGGAAWGDFADDSAHSGRISGKAEIAAAFAKVYAQPGFRLAWHPDYARVFGDIGVTSGPYLRQIRAGSGQEESETGRYVTVWHRQADGSWRFVWDGGTAGVP
jgi:ketosteroid isomerase-like protein